MKRVGPLLALTLALSACSAADAISLASTAAQVILATEDAKARAGTVPAGTTALPSSAPFPGTTLPSPRAPVPAAGVGKVADATESADEKALYELFMTYRAEMGLPPIPRSPSLAIVARTHVRDLEAHTPDEDAGCNMHSWSDDGPWKGMCYTRDHAQGAAMWSKPSELSSYRGNGYEIAHWFSAKVTPAGALAGWQGSPAHNAVIINEGTWADDTWNAIGVGMSEHYAVTWFGKEP